MWDRLPARLLCTRFFRCPLDGGRRWYAAVSPDLPIQEGFCKAFIAATGRFVQPVYARRAAAAVLAVKAFLHVVSLLCGSPPIREREGASGDRWVKCNFTLQVYRGCFLERVGRNWTEKQGDREERPGAPMYAFRTRFKGVSIKVYSPPVLCGCKPA